MSALVAVVLVWSVHLVKEVKAEFRKLQGEWACVAAEVQGKPWPKAEKMAKWRMAVEGDIWTRTFDDGHKSTCRIRINPTKSPKHMDLYNMEFDPRYFGNDPTKAIYKWDGETLVICLGEWQKRPTEFESKKVGAIVYVWKRVKK